MTGIVTRPAIFREIAETRALLANAIAAGDEDAIPMLEIELAMLRDDLAAGRTSRHDQDPYEPDDLEIPPARATPGMAA